jgi:DNA polymerase-1
MGLRACVRDNGRVATRISTLSETGRWKHSEPNLANLPKNKEKGIEKIFGAKVPLVRSCFKAKEGWVFIEADYKSAELFTLGYMSGDPEFNKVLDQEPDVHGYNAVQIFGLDCAPKEVEEKYPALRAAIKTTVFGLVYGLGPDGLAEQLTPIMKRHVPGEEAQGIIDGLMRQYPGIKNFIEDSKKDVEQKGYTETAFGRRRYFPGFSTMARAKQAAAKREGVNSRIQGTVGDYLNLASIHLDNMRYDSQVGREIGWEYMVAIHDAMLLHCPKSALKTMARILKYCMSDTIAFPTRPDKTLQVDVQYGERWGEFTKLKEY